ncbi:MAG: hypothetical protein LC754_02910 [Acidobacteria bacterium]|nr:hypothetical protein [Acidobacteriota bacterium]
MSKPQDDESVSSLNADEKERASEPDFFTVIKAEPTEAEKRARQISELVEKERRRRRRSVALYASLMLVPIALAGWGIMSGSGLQTFGRNESDVRLLVFAEVDAQLRPVVEEKLGSQIETVVQTKVEDQLKGTNPAKVGELSKQVDNLKTDLSLIQTSVNDVKEVKAQLSAQASTLRELQQRPIPTPAQQFAEVSKLTERLDRLEGHINRSLGALNEKVEGNARAIQAITNTRPGREIMGRRQP